MSHTHTQIHTHTHLNGWKYSPCVFQAFIHSDEWTSKQWALEPISKAAWEEAVHYGRMPCLCVCVGGCCHGNPCILLNLWQVCLSVCLHVSVLNKVSERLSHWHVCSFIWLSVEDFYSYWTEVTSTLTHRLEHQILIRGRNVCKVDPDS